MNILVVGSGGREHALVWKLKQSPKIKNIFVAPGNAGTSLIATNLDFYKTKDILEWVKNNKVELVVVGPDNYLAEGLVDKLQKMGISAFGPTKKASEIEWSKSFAKNFMREEGIPTAKFETFKSFKKARKYLETQKFPLVIKANGLAFGKGVVIALNLTEAEKSLKQIMRDKIYGKAGHEVLIEEYLTGKEISIHAFCDGKTAIMFPVSEDHKRIFDDDLGPNTGGMGTIAPVPWVTKRHLKEIEEKIITPTLQGLKRKGRIFKGILFPGIMLTNYGPKVIEFNARFGDPEIQSYVHLLETDLLDILLACVKGDIKNLKIKWSKSFACCVVTASKGYPIKYDKNKVVKGLEKITDKNIEIFHSGTKKVNNKILTNGGRVLGFTAVGRDLSQAVSRAYRAVDQVSYEGKYFRKDIGKKSL